MPFWSRGSRDKEAGKSQPTEASSMAGQESAAISSAPSAQSERVVEVLTAAAGLAGGWPAELPRDTFKTVDFDRLVERLKDYQEREYPPGLLGSDHSKPDYRIIGGKIGRASNLVQDMKLCTQASMPGQRKVDTNDPEAMARAVFQLVEHYAMTRLARFLFMIPTARDEVDRISRGKKSIVVGELLVIEVLKGVEQLLLEICGEVGFGSFGDAEVTQKFLSVVDSARTE